MSVPLLKPKPALSIDQVARIAYAAGFRGAGLAMAIAVSAAESAFVPNARLVNNPTSIDRGLWQVNSFWHKEYSDACCDDPACCAKAAFTISKAGATWVEWSTYKSGAYLAHLADAQRASLRVHATATEHLDRPFHGPAVVTQPFGPTAFDKEPPAFLWPDGSITYYAAGPGAVRIAHGHSGVDYGIKNGTQLYAPAGGKVKSAGRDNLGPNGTDSGFGLMLMIQHASVTTLYGHLSSIEVVPGQVVARGQPIAHSGGVPGIWQSGLSTSAHLHWSCIRLSDNHYVDPALYIFAPDAPLPKPTPLHPGDPFRPVLFTVYSQDDKWPVKFYAGPSTQTPVLGQVKGKHKIDCYGVTTGEKRFDRTVRKPDPNWFLTHLPSIGWAWVASARVLGNAPGSTR